MSFILRRLVFYLVTAWVALTINFLIPRLMPGNAVVPSWRSSLTFNPPTTRR